MGTSRCDLTRELGQTRRTAHPLKTMFTGNDRSRASTGLTGEQHLGQLTNAQKTGKCLGSLYYQEIYTITVSTIFALSQSDSVQHDTQKGTSCVLGPPNSLRNTERLKKTTRDFDDFSIK